MNNNRAKTMIEDYLPQRPPILLLENIISIKNDEICCRVNWQQAVFFHDAEGKLIPVAMSEMMAQTAAVMNSVQNYSPKRPDTIGLLTSIKNFHFYSYPEDTPELKVILRQDSRLGKHQIVKGKVYQGDNLLAEGILFLFHSD